MSQEGANRLLTWLLGVAAPILPTVHLLGQPYTPLTTSLLTNYAANQVGPGIGYAPVQLTSPRASWTVSGLQEGAQALYLPVNWTFTAAVTVYGYYISDDNFGVSLWGEALSPAFVYGAGGGVFALEPYLYLVNFGSPS
jgi:hypothetical protein